MKFLKNSIVALAAILTTSAFASDYIETSHGRVPVFKEERFDIPNIDKDFRVFGAEGTTYIVAGSEYCKIYEKTVTPDYDSDFGVSDPIGSEPEEIKDKDSYNPMYVFAGSEYCKIGDN